MIAAILVLIVALVVLFACLIGRGTCSNATQIGFHPTNTPAPEQSETPEDSATPAIETPIILTMPPETFTVDPTQPAASAGPMPTAPTLPQSPYPSIPYCVTEGTMEDVHARLEALKRLPAGETIILLDVGHGGFDGGTVGIDTGATEADINLQIARMVAQRLAAKGYFVFMTRMGDYACAGDKNADMRWRTQVMKLGIFDASISIHQNALDTDRNVRGARIYCYRTGTEGEKLAKCIIGEFTQISSYAKTNPYTGNLMVVREPVCPSALIECGFLSNPEEELLLQDPNYRAQIAQAAANGVENYLKGGN